MTMFTWIKRGAFTAFLAAALAATLHHPAQAANVSTACPTEIDWPTIRSLFRTQSGIAIKSATNFVAADLNAQLDISQSLPSGAALGVFRIVETAPDPTIPDPPLSELLVQSVRAVSYSDDFGVQPGAPSTNQIWVQFRPRQAPWSLWRPRQFLVLRCVNGSVAGWGMVVARVSGQWMPPVLCTTVALLTYLLAMKAVQVSRRTAHPLAEAYPALFAVKKLELVDFINPIHLITNVFNKASVQKLQVLLFSFLVGWLLMSMILRTGSLTAISVTVAGLLGISGVGAAVAGKTYQQANRLSFESWCWLVSSKVLILTGGEGPRWRDLVLTNRDFDVYKLQTIIFSVAVAVAMIVGGGSHLSTFEVPQTLLGILGLSQVVYIGGILVQPPSTANLDALIKKTWEARDLGVRAVAQGVDVDMNGQLTVVPDPAKENPSKASLNERIAGAVNALRNYETLIRQLKVALESTLEVSVDISVLALQNDDFGKTPLLPAANGLVPGIAARPKAADASQQNGAMYATA